MIEKVECPKCGCFNKVTDNFCWKCKRPIDSEDLERHREKVSREKAKRDNELRIQESELQNRLEMAKDSGDWSCFSKEELSKISESVILTTSFQISKMDIIKEIEIITSEVVYGVNVFKDVMVQVRDIFGGKSETMKKVLRDARKEVLEQLKIEAYCAGANAVICVDLDYQEITGSGKNGLMMLVASGTAVVASPQ
ncbi:YbjQ family protein [Bacterioplanoides pacificum]|uniref:UPF0145 protein ACFOMG_17445 n=1 Tax=Bacterioplanoides pacificum TaxID=1171596 RepID=A0ABV7VWI7_9GAMM